MERERFERIVSRMESLNASDPDAYRRRVQRFANLGFGVYCAAFLLVMALLGLVLFSIMNNGVRASGIRLVLTVGFLAFVFLRALWIKIEPPTGVEIGQADAPELMSEIDRIGAQVGAPRIHAILVNDDFNAFATSAPKFAIFGERCYVVLGLPLMLLQRPDEVLATIGHELAHHSRSHVRSSARAYRLESMWRGVVVQLSAAGSVFVWPMLWFARWYAPRFSAMSLVLRRQAEFEADAVGALATSKQAMVTGLLRMVVDGATRLKSYHERLSIEIAQRKTPPSDYSLALSREPAPSAESAHTALVRALKSETVYEDSHPALRERTEALGTAADPGSVEDVEHLLALVGQVEVSAAERFFGERLQDIAARVDRAWQERVRGYWEERHAEAGESVAVLARYEGRPLETLNEREAADFVRALGVVRGFAGAAGPAVALADRFPTNGELQYFAGHCLVENDDDRGVAYLERAAELDARTRSSALEAIASFRASRGDSRAARTAAIAASEADDKTTEVYSELLDLKSEHGYATSEADPAEINRILSELPRLKHVTEAYSFQRSGQGVRLDVLALVAKRPVFVKSDEDFIAKTTKEAYELIGQTRGVYVLVVVQGTPPARRLERLPNLRVYPPTASP